MLRWSKVLKKNSGASFLRKSPLLGLSSMRLAHMHLQSAEMVKVDTSHPKCNVPPSIIAKMNVGLLHKEGHPLFQIKSKIQNYFESGQASVGRKFEVFDHLHPVVTTKQNFDDLLTPLDHVSRSPTDTFYIDENNILRCHMTAHQVSLLEKGSRAFLMMGEVYRRDAVDATHYPIFHQIDGVRVFSEEEYPAEFSKFSSLMEGEGREAAVAFVMNDLKSSLEGMALELFGKDTEMRWVEAYFPFTDPSLELEIKFNGEWLELLGCGMIRQKILTNCGLEERIGWAFGMGVERLAMAMYAIPDIRLFWSEDPRFMNQFKDGGVVKFEPYSKNPACYKDVSFWLPADESSFHENDLMAMVREVAGDLCESVSLIDDFTNPKTGKRSKCYRINYRSIDRTLTNTEVNDMQDKVLSLLTAVPDLKLR